MSLQKLRVIAVSKQPTEVIKIEFETLNGEKLNYEAGQFITLVFKMNEKELRRSYSFCSSPHVEEPIAIAVKLVINPNFKNLRLSVSPSSVCIFFIIFLVKFNRFKCEFRFIWML